MDWNKLVKKRQEMIVNNTQDFLQIKSVLDEATASSYAPFGEGIRKAYNWLLHKAEKDGFTVKDLDGKAAHIEWGEGEELVGVLCHIDVVPEGEGWTTPAFDADIRNGKIYARGALDDKGPTMAAYHALKLLKDKGVKLEKRVRLIIGTDEESQWRCVSHYFDHEEMPSLGFAPDADFPIIYAEKGIADLTYKLDLWEEQGLIRSFSSGSRLNMVPDFASAVINKKELDADFQLKEIYKNYLAQIQAEGGVEEDSDTVLLTFSGRSAHGMEPEDGLNAGLYLADFLCTMPLKEYEKRFFYTLNDYFLNDSRGKKAGVNYMHKELGDLTINIGTIKFEGGNTSSIGINLRYPDGVIFNSVKQRLDRIFTSTGFTGSIISHAPPHAVNKDHQLVRTLSKVYESQTSSKADLIAIGGGTYARSLKAGVAFGPLFPGQKDVVHQADEYIDIDNLVKITAMYAEAIYELCNQQ
ncbi:dipeptidase PepV [Salipaludibacillus aurantiacus]|uniref:Succinyl-diaminopimelate desuccinylase n=1 Tax=Salipaludibacillus aurantiacus TaxID=1601833 RepID=A0A1H9WLZ3_9BACI|nr:dipeptidase PepV [Salipaludibacillus aurantiacus]SES34910.1 succinyl-diaminopimelate desuccinylase [Salipaludibacillus aurantiacus]